MNIALIGMMGTMKSMAGAELAKLTRRELFDTDKIFESEWGMTVAEAFSARGEAFFREKESGILARLAAKTDAVISCGGGVPTVSANLAPLKKCTVFLLTATPEEICRRLKGDTTRPLLREITIGNVRGIMDARRQAYGQAADFTVSTDGKTPREIALEIISLSGLQLNLP